MPRNLENLRIILRNTDGAAKFNTTKHNTNVGHTFKLDCFD